MNNTRLEKIQKLINKKLKGSEYNRVVIKTYEGLYLLKNFPSYDIEKIDKLPNRINYIFEDISIIDNKANIDDLIIVSDGREKPIIIIDTIGKE